MLTVASAAVARRQAGLLHSAPLWLFLIALTIRAVIISLTHFDGLYGQDSFAYLNCVVQILDRPAAGMPCRDSHWPLGYPGLAAVFGWVLRAATLGGQWSSIVTGAACAPLAYWMTLATGNRRDRDSAVAAGLIAALCGQLILSSLVIMSDAAGVFWAMVAVVLLLRWDAADGHKRQLLPLLPAAGAALGMAVVTRWVYAGLLIPCGAFVWVSMRQRARQRTSLRPDVAAMIAATGVFSVLVGLQLRLNALSPAPVLQHGWVVGWNLAGAWHSSFDNLDGHFLYRLPPLIFYAEPVFHPLYLSPLLTLPATLGAWHLRRSRALILLGGWMAVLYLYLIGVPYENGRFALAFFPPVAVLAAIGLFQRPNARAGRPARRWGLLAMSLLITLGAGYRSLAAFESAFQQQMTAIRHLQAAVPADATIVSFGLSISLVHYTSYKIVDLYGQSPPGLRRVVCGSRPAFLYIDRDNLEAQWPGRSPLQNVHWLRDSIGLVQISSSGPWILYRVAACGTTD